MESKKNPADCASRGLSVESFLATESWIRGQDFIWKLDDSWPKRPSSFGEIMNDDPEVKREIVAFPTTVETVH